MTKTKVKTQSIEETYRKHSGSLSRFLSRFLDSRVEIEDVVQEAFLKTYEAERNVEIKAPASFLFKTAKNLALNIIAMRQRRRTDAVADFEELPVLYDVELLSKIDPESQNIIEEQLLQAGAALEKLTPRAREVFVLRKVYGFSHKEISSRLGIAVSTVEKHIASGLLQMERYNYQSNPEQNDRCEKQGS